MKRLLLLTVLLSLLISCSGRKQIEKAINSGNYDVAITDALKKLENNKDNKRKQDFVVMLKDAYYKAVDRDLNTINHLKKDGNPANYKTIYEMYLDLNARQEAIKPVLPLRVNNQNITFDFNDYADDIVTAKANVSSYFYDEGVKLLNSDNKQNIRQAFKTLDYVNKINPNYRDVRQLLDEAYQKGTIYVSVSIHNETNQIIPKRLEDELLNFDTYGLDQFWVEYHANPDRTIEYDYAMELQLKRINISPERINERQLLRERNIVDGWQYVLDSNGNVKKDSLGNDIKEDKIVNVKARFNEFIQTKNTQIISDVVYIDLVSKKLIDRFTIDSGFAFENVYATYRGDERALTREDLDLVRNRRVPFPSNEQMVYDTGEDLKLKLKNIIKSYKIRT